MTPLSKEQIDRLARIRAVQRQLEEYHDASIAVLDAEIKDIKRISHGGNSPAPNPFNKEQTNDRQNRVQ